MERGAGVADRPEVHAGGSRVGRTPARAHRQQECPLGSELLHGVVEVVGAINSVVGADRDAVRADEEILTPRALKPAVTVEDHDRVVSPVDPEDPLPGAGRDAGYLAE